MALGTRSTVPPSASRSAPCCCCVAAAVLVPAATAPDDEGALTPRRPARRTPRATRRPDRGTRHATDAGRDRAGCWRRRRPRREPAASPPTDLADRLVRCADVRGAALLPGRRLDRPPTPSWCSARAAAAPHPASALVFAETTGDLSHVATCSPGGSADAGRPRSRPSARSSRPPLAASRRSCCCATSSSGSRFPTGFLERHPEARAPTPSDRGPRADADRPRAIADYPERSTVLSPRGPREQHRTYWCGPTTMQMIAWGWQQGSAGPAGTGRDKLGTTTAGSAISEMVRVVNGSHGLRPARRTPATTSCSTSPTGPTRSGCCSRCGTSRTTGHRSCCTRSCCSTSTPTSTTTPRATSRSVGATTSAAGSRPTSATSNRGTSSGSTRRSPTSPGVQWRRAYQSYRANQAHPHQNIGV